MPKMIFRGARVRYYDGRLNDEGGQFTRIHLSADFSDPIREAMDWGVVQDGATKSDLEGSLVATNLILTPNGKELSEHELQLGAQEVKDFQFVRGKSAKDGTVKEDRLDFVVVSAEHGAAAKVEEYVRVIGKGQGALRIGYTEQEQMDIGGKGDDNQQERLISTEQAEDTKKEDGKGGDEQSLASAATTGGTHQKKKK